MKNAPKQFNVKQLQGLAIISTDGRVGKLYEVYIDPSSWRLAYIVADIGDWMVREERLVSSDDIVSVSLSGIQIGMNREALLSGMGPEGVSPLYIQAKKERSLLFEAISGRNLELKIDLDNLGLLSSRELVGYKVIKSGRSIGRVADARLDCSLGSFPSLIIKQCRYSSKEISISTELISSIVYGSSLIVKEDSCFSEG